MDVGITGNPLTTTQVGQYGGAGGFDPKLVVQGEIAAGTAIYFYIDGVQAQCALPGGLWQTSHPFSSGDVTELDLKVGEAVTTTPTPTNTATRTVTPSTTPTASNTPTPSRTATRTATPSTTPTASVTPAASNTPMLSDTPTPSRTPTASSTPTRTLTPSTTPTASVTPTASTTPMASTTPTATSTPLPGLRIFSGHVYQGVHGEYSLPLAGACILLYGSDDPHVVPGTWLASRTTGSDGRFEIATSSVYFCYNLIEDNPPGYYSVGAAPGAGAIGKGRDWLQYLDVRPGVHGGNAFFDLPEVVETPTPTCSPTPSITPTPTETPMSFGTIDGVIWEDANRNAALDLQERGFGAVTVALYYGGVPYLSTTTNGNGFFGFVELPYGDYEIQVTDRNGVLTEYKLTTPGGPISLRLTAEQRAVVVLFGYSLPFDHGLYLPLVYR